jgi:acyl dehydratase
VSGGLFYEDLTTGQRYVSGARTVTETDLVMFSMLSGDWNPIHADEVFSSATNFGRRVVHGLFGMALLTGLMDRAGWFATSGIAMLGVDGWRFVTPIFVGDTLHVVMEIQEVRLASSRDRGIAGRRFTLVNQRDEVVQEGDIPMLIACRKPDE